MNATLIFPYSFSQSGAFSFLPLFRFFVLRDQTQITLQFSQRGTCHACDTAGSRESGQRYRSGSGCYITKALNCSIQFFAARHLSGSRFFKETHSSSYAADVIIEQRLSRKGRSAEKLFFTSRQMASQTVVSFVHFHRARERGVVSVRCHASVGSSPRCL